MAYADRDPGRGFSTIAGVLLGLGVGGFFDGIILHQVLQWHPRISSAGFPPNSLGNLKLNILWDGFFHLATYVFTLAGMILLWRKASQPHDPWSWKMLVGTILMGFGTFNLVEGIVDHQILGIHHVNETAPPDQWIYWDIGFLIWDALMLAGGRLMLQAGRRETSESSGAIKLS
jgi:uncharacterized membrane protein